MVRSRLRYGQVEKLGISYSYDYRLTFADHRYENAFFTELKRLGRKAPLTNAQELYNGQPNKAAEVTNNTEIPAPAVERWLADHPPRRVDTRRNTVFLINWYGRSDFRFHVYTKTDEPDPDTGYNFGTQRASRKLTAWGGTTARDEQTGLGRTRRVWFHDLSAGPEEWAGSWNITDDDLDGDAGPDYRIPPIWEYGHYRPQAALSGDLSKLVRYVAIDLLFTTSPLYPAELPTPEPPRRINLDVNTYEGWPGVDASSRYIQPEPGHPGAAGTAPVQPAGLRQPGSAVHRRGQAVLPRDLAEYVPCYPDAFIPHGQPLPAEHPGARPDQGRRRPGRLRTADLRLCRADRRRTGPGLRRRQLCRRHPELRVRLHLAGDRRRSATD